MRIKKPFGILALALFLSAPAAAGPLPPILIAHVAPTTGRFALHAEADRRGAEMAIEDFNQQGGVLGREIVLVSRNPTMDGKQAAAVAEELITRKQGRLHGRRPSPPTSRRACRRWRRSTA